MADPEGMQSRPMLESTQGRAVSGNWGLSAPRVSLVGRNGEMLDLGTSMEFVSDKWAELQVQGLEERERRGRLGRQTFPSLPVRGGERRWLQGDLG